MHHRPFRKKRRAATTVELAIVLPVTFALVLAIMIGGVGVFRYQQVAHLARETARFASVHGGQYAKNHSGNIAAGTLPNVNEDYLTSFAKSRAVGLDKSQLKVKATMTVITPGAKSASTTETVAWDNTTENLYRSPYSAWTDTTKTPPVNVEVSNVVTVQVTYSWSPGLFGMGSIDLTSTAVMLMSY
jgi:Flp pilus assembly protein TadG